MARFRTCSVCGKVFIMAAMHLYKLSYKDKVYVSCSYKCYRQMQKELEEIKNAKKSSKGASQSLKTYD